MLGGLLLCHRAVKNVGDLVGATGSGIGFPVGNEQFSLREEDLLRCPVDVVVLTIRNVGVLIGLQLDDRCAANVKVGKMCRGNPVLGQRETQFLDADDSSVNNGKWIDRSAN